MKQRDEWPYRPYTPYTPVTHRRAGPIGRGGGVLGLGMRPLPSGVLPVVFNFRNFFANIEAVSHQDRVMEIDWGMLFRNTTA